jgi:O-antigen ligase
MHADSALVQGNRTRALINLVANVGVALYILSRVRTTRQRNIVLGCLGIGLAFACLVGLLQSLTDIDLRFFFQPEGFVANTDELEMGERWGATRVMGTSQHAIEFSLLAAITVPLAIYFARNATKWPVRLAAMLTCGVALAAMPAAISRTGLIALAAAVLVYMWSFKLRHLVVGVVVGGLALGAYILTFPNITNALYNTIVNSEQDPSVLSRTADYALVSTSFHAHPIFGLGLGGTPPAQFGYLDNEWLQAVVQGGIVGITAMIVLAGGALFGIAAALRVATTQSERNQAYTLGSMIVASLVCTYTFDLFNFQQAVRIFFIVFALLWCNFAVSFGGATTTPIGVRMKAFPTSATEQVDSQATTACTEDLHSKIHRAS